MNGTKTSSPITFSNPNNTLPKFCPSQILIYTRPWEVRFHIELGKALQERHGGASLRFVTFFSLARRLVAEAGLECVYLPDELLSTSANEISDKQLEALDNNLYQYSGIGLYFMLTSERFLPRDAALADKFLRKHVVVLDRLVQPGTLSISSMYDHFVYWLAGSLANMRDGAHFALTGCGVPAGRVLALKTPWRIWQSPTMENDESLGLEHLKLNLEKHGSVTIEYMQPNPVPSLAIRWMSRLEEIVMNTKDLRAKSYFATKWRVWHRYFSLRNAKSTERANTILMDLLDEESISSKRFVYVPLHMEPEASILMYSPWLRNQVELVRLVSQSIPFGCDILVKENPKMLPLRSPEYLKQLKAIPGVQLVHPKCSSIYLSKRAICTISLAGTACLEAALLGKNSLVMGDPPFTFLRPDMIVGSGKELYNRLSQLTREPKNKNEMGSISQQAWERWLKGSFKGSAIPFFRKSNGSISAEWQIDYGATNVDAYVRYITGCLR